MEAWYALNTKPRAEARVYQTLNLRGFRVLLPMLPGRQQRRPEPLFPSYLFVRCDLDVVGLSTLEFVPGLRRILAFAGRPAVVPDEVIALIEEKLAEIDARGGLPSHSFHPGDEVVIDSGPMRGMRGIFQGPMGPAERVQVLIQFLGHANRAEVPVELLRTAPQRGEARRGTRGHGRQIRYRNSPKDSDDRSHQE